MYEIIRPIIFLDIDGPFKTCRSRLSPSFGFSKYKKRFTKGLDMVAVETFKKILTETKTKPIIILSSSWKDDLGYKLVSKYLGFKIHGQTINNGTRKEEIQYWINLFIRQNNSTENTIFQYIVVDDIAMKSSQLRDNQILAVSGEGLTKQNFVDFAQMLGVDFYKL